MKLHALRISSLTTLKDLIDNTELNVYSNNYTITVLFNFIVVILQKYPMDYGVIHLRSVLQTKCNLKSQSV